MENGVDGLDLDVLIVGAGFGGCYLLKLLRKQGLRVEIVEAGPTLGGVWCWNRYPGARVDCELPYYGYSDPAIWNTWYWTKRFPSDAELREYFQHVDKVWDLSKDVSFNTRVTGARWENGHWSVEIKERDSIKCRWFLAATGTSFKPYAPEWRGKELYRGLMHHSALWPDGIDMTGKRVAVIGAGSSGVQIMQEAGKVAAHVTHYIRTPNLAVPMRQRDISVDEIYQQKSTIPHVFKACRETATGLPIVSTGKKTFEDPPEAREAVYEEGWRRGGFNWSRGAYTDYVLDKEANRDLYNFWAKKIRARVKDPKKRELLAPLEPPYFIGTKRPSLEQDYYEQCDKPYVRVTNSPIKEINETGIVTEDGAEEFDIIAVATGFDAVTGGLRTMGIKGKGGVDLQDYWEDGVKTLVGMMVHGYPNMFMVYGPQAPTSFTNGPPFIELQCEWINDAISKQRQDGYNAVEARKSEEEAWSKQVQDVANMTLAVQTDSWYMGANIPGKRREMLVYMGGIPKWHQAARDALHDWNGFDVDARHDYL